MQYLIKHNTETVKDQSDLELTKNIALINELQHICFDYFLEN